MDEEMLAFIKKIAAKGICDDDEGAHCWSDSGPCCGAHSGVYAVEDEIKEARALLQKVGEKLNA